MNNLLLNNLINDLSKISSLHDNCLDDLLKLYTQEDYSYTNLEQTITKIVNVDKKISEEKKEENNIDSIEIYFHEEYDNVQEISGTINSLMIENASDIEI